MRFLSLAPFLALPALLVAREANDVQPDPSHYDAPTAIRQGFVAHDARKDPWEQGALVKRWRQWVRRQDDKTTETKSDEPKSTEVKESKTEEKSTTEDKPTTTENKPTSTEVSTTEEKSTTEPSSTQESSTQESSTVVSTSTETSTETSTDSSSTTSSSQSTTKAGASCYSTTVSTSVVCSITTGGRTESHSCVTNKMTSSTCSPGLFCTIHPDSGDTVCMEQHNEFGTEGIVVAAFFGAAIAGCMAVLVGMCLRDRKQQKKLMNLQRVKTLRTAKREEQANLMAGAT
ncbi:hypothetical protein F53441_3357 [Fusarium austroafricanum]|uniref:Uncharacterized protein n=1 Tax=Fusarium austroafricanum TaxID=2364996 RepID=A0A8H4KMX7_9HYPO|nr:hypothetical protein F53441_3357 [Fusarium austroafricanum]